MTLKKSDPQLSRVWMLFCLLIFATVLSIATSGFEFGSGNNLYHIPYVLQYGDLEQFRSDALYHSLDKFASIIWPLIRLFSNEQNVAAIFLTGAVASRALAFLALLWFFRMNCENNTKILSVSLISAAACSWMMGSSQLGAHGIFIPNFTHSEVTWGPLLAAIIATQCRRLVLAGAFAGVVFSINAFVGVWLLVVLSFAVVFDPQRYPWKTIIHAGLVFILLCSPVIVWVALDLPKNAKVPHFSYIEYIRAYFPQHFLIEAASIEKIVTVLLFAVCGFAAAWFQKNKNFWNAVLAGCLFLLVAGAVLPYFFNERFIFNLHLLRADGLLQFFAAILSIYVGVRLLLSNESDRAEKILAMLLLFVLMAPPLRWYAVLSAAISLSMLVWKRSLSMRKNYSDQNSIAVGESRWNIIAISAVVSAMVLETAVVEISASFVPRWTLMCFSVGTIVVLKRYRMIALMAIWASMVLLAIIIPVKWRQDNVKSGPLAANTVSAISTRIKTSQLQGPFLFPVDTKHRPLFDNFQLDAQRTVWVDWKQGAAVMWDPEFYWQWMPRFNEVNHLHTIDEFLAYARLKRIPYIIVPTDLGQCPTGAVTLFGNAAATVCKVSVN